MDFDTYKRYGLHIPPPRAVNGRSSDEIVKSTMVPEDNQYNPCAEAYPGSQIPTGEFNRIRDWAESKIYPGTTRTISIYQSASLANSSEMPAFVYFNDGDFYLAREGAARATRVFDSMCANGELPPLIAVFVNAGVSESEPAQRSIEYDTVSDQHVTFIDTEIVPLVEFMTGKTLASEPSKRLICGISSGGICAFTAAWHSPTSFGRVLSHCGSFVNLRGGHNYPSMIRRTPRIPIRVFLQSGKRDANIVPGSWPIANQDVAAALDYAGYDYRFEFGEGGHSLRHGGAIFAESLRWLFRV